jgi:spermidine/putrescine transport system substrate-binding protein
MEVRMNGSRNRWVNIIFVIMAAAAVMSVSFPGCSTEKAKDELTVYVWEGYLPETVADMFEQETGITLNVNLISDNASIFTLLKGGGKADVIMPTQNQVNRFYEEGLALAMDLGEIENYENVTGSFRGQSWSMWDGSQMGQGDTYAIPYVFGTSGIVVNTGKYEGPTEGIGWEILFDTQLKDRVSSRDSAESIMICMDLLGIPRQDLVDDMDATLEKVRDKALQLKENVLKFYSTGAELLDMMANEEVWVSHIWDGGARKLASGDDKFVYILPSTGGFGWTDTFMIPAASDNPKGAHMFIDFMLQPEIAAMVISEGGYTTTVKGSIDLAEGIDKGLYTFKDEEMANLVWQINFPEDVIAAYNDFWEELSTVN